MPAQTTPGVHEDSQAVEGNRYFENEKSKNRQQSQQKISGGRCGDGRRCRDSGASDGVRKVPGGNEICVGS